MIGIVGGGLSGLFLLHLLRRRGVDAVLFEAADTPGGVVRSVRIPASALVVDLGPQRFRLTAGLARIVEEVGLEPELVQAPHGVPFSVLWKGKLHPAPMSLAQGVRTPLISPLGKVEAFVRDLVGGPPRRGESVAGVLKRKLGPEVYERLAGPLFGGLYGSDPAEMDAEDSLLHALRRTRGGPRNSGTGEPGGGGRGHSGTGAAGAPPRSFLLALRRAARAERVPVVSFRDGLGALPRALAAAHADRVRLSTPVTAIRPGAGLSGGFELVTGEGGESVPVERIVLALPAPEAGPLLRGIAFGASVRLGRLRYNPLAVVPLLAPAGAGDDRGAEAGPVAGMGSGFKVTDVEPYETRGVTAHEALFGRRGLYTAFLGGRHHETFVTRPEEEILETARREFREIAGMDATPLFVHRTRMPAWDRTWRALDEIALPPGIHLCAAYSDRPGIPGRLEEASRVAEALAPTR